MLGLRQEEQGERGPPTWAKGSVLGPSRVPGLQDPAARCTLQKAASAVGCPLPHPGADTVGNPAPSSSSSPAPRPSSFVGLCGGLEGASALPQDRRCGLRRAGAGRPLPWPWAAAPAADGPWRAQGAGGRLSVLGWALPTDGLISPLSRGILS